MSDPADAYGFEEPYTGPIIRWRLVFRNVADITHDAGTFRHEGLARVAAARLIRNARARGLRVRIKHRGEEWLVSGRPGTVTRFDSIGSIELFEQDVS